MLAPHRREEAPMKIDVATLIAVSQDLFARYDATTQTHARADLAYEAVGILRAFVRGAEAEEERERRYDAEAAYRSEDADPF
jgi:hypothetical protein